MSWLGSRKASVGTWWAISVVLGVNGLRNEPSHLAGPPFLPFKARFSSMLRVWHMHFLTSHCHKSDTYDITYKTVQTPTHSRM